mmetsp:Transcript_6814/g.10987  ORF Transcript_6814/g.10987 Transcript_6814/m.10987 type:complete len:100 (-) Transcript_6814:1569-1868(-)
MAYITNHLRRTQRFTVKKGGRDSKRFKLSFDNLHIENLGPKQAEVAFTTTIQEKGDLFVHAESKVESKLIIKVEQLEEYRPFSISIKPEHNGRRCTEED